MAELTKKEMLRIVDDNISKLENKDFNMYFFVLDTKGNPSSALEYIYQTAYVLSELGYKVKMLHQEKEFVGVGDWLGEKYAKLPHANIEKENVELTPSDFLFIPEIFANVMMQTKKLPCKRVVLVQNYSHITEFMPVSQTLENLNITDVITTTKVQEEKIKDYFPYVHTHVVSPSIKKVFRNNDNARSLIVNLISKEKSDIHQIVKPFYWKNPLYKWVSFNDIRNMSQETFSEALRKGAITIWIDDNTQFGYSLLEALRCGSIVLAKVPKNESDWMAENGELTDSILWFEHLDDVPDMLAAIVRSWTRDEIPEEIIEKQKNFDNLYSEETQAEEIKRVYVDTLIKKRLDDFKETKVDIENNVLKTKED